VQRILEVTYCHQLRRWSQLCGRILCILDLQAPHVCWWACNQDGGRKVDGSSSAGMIGHRVSDVMLECSSITQF